MYQYILIFKLKIRYDKNIMLKMLEFAVKLDKLEKIVPFSYFFNYHISFFYWSSSIIFYQQLKTNLILFKKNENHMLN